MEIPENSVNVGATEANRLIYLFKERNPAAVDGLQHVPCEKLHTMLRRAVQLCGGEMTPLGYTGWIYQFSDRSVIWVTSDGEVRVQ